MNSDDKNTINAYLLGMRATLKGCATYELSAGIELFRMSLEGSRDFIEDLFEQGVIRVTPDWYNEFYFKASLLEVALSDVEGNSVHKINPFSVVDYQKEPKPEEKRTPEEDNAFKAMTFYEYADSQDNLAKYSLEANPFLIDEFKLLISAFEDYQAFCKELVEKS